LASWKFRDDFLTISAAITESISVSIPAEGNHVVDWSIMMAWMMVVALATPPPQETPVVVDGLVRLLEVVDVPARRDGRLEKMMVKEGDDVHQGDLLGGLDDSEAKLTMKRAELEFKLAAEKAQSEIALNYAFLTQVVAREEFRRAEQAKKSSPASISASEIDKLKLEADKANSEVARCTEEKRFALLASQSRETELLLSRLALEERRLISPLNGIVTQLHRREGEWVHLGEKVVRVVRIDRLRVEAYLNLQSGLVLFEHAPVVLEVGFVDSPLQEFAGEVVFMNPEADPVNGQIRIWAEIENRDRLLRPGQKGRLKLFPKKKTPSAIPTTRHPEDQVKPDK